MRSYYQDRDSSSGSDNVAGATSAPGKRTLTQTLVPRSTELAAPSAAPAAAESATGGEVMPMAPSISGGLGDGFEELLGRPAPGARTPPGPGTELPDALRGKMERSFGADFSDVRVHEGAHAREVGAIAYAEGNHLHFAPGAYDPASQSGQELLGHELTHVVQQRAGGTAVAQGKRAADASLEAEADALGARAAAGEPVTVTGRATAGIQRKLDTVALETLRTRVFEAARARGVPEVAAQVVELLDGEFDRLDLAEAAIDLAFAHVRGSSGPSTSPLGPSTWTSGPPTSTPAVSTSSSTPAVSTSSSTPAVSTSSSTPAASTSSASRQPAFTFTLEPIVIDGQAVRGTDDPEGGLDELAIELSEWDPAEHEVQQLYRLLRERRAPGDEARMEHLREYATLRAAYRDDGSDSEFEEPDFHQDSDDGEYTDTDGSDSEDERQHREQMATSPASSQHQARTKRVRARLKHSLYEDRLKKVADPDERDDVLYKGDWRPEGKTLYRKEAKFNHPSEDVGDRARLAEPSEAESEDLAHLNLMLSHGVPMEVALTSLPNATQFLVAQYRGMWYPPSKFSRDQRRRHRDLDERGRPIYSQAALAEGSLGTSGYYALYNDPARRPDLERYQAELSSIGLEIRATLQALASIEPDPKIKNAVGRNTERFQPQHLGDVSTHFYSESYDPYFKGLVGARERAKSGAPAQPLDALYQGLPNTGNPKVSTGDVPVHSAKYSYGMKPYAGHEDDVLEPEYDELGTPRHPYSGKTYTSLHPLTDYDPTRGPTQLVPLQNAHRINISQMIIPERESQFDGMLEADRVVAQYKSKFPDFFKPYKDVYAVKYGLTRDLFEAFADAMMSTSEGSAERTYVESLLSSYLSKHSELRAIEDAQEMAAARGARLVYRTGPASFGFAPPQIETSRATSTGEPSTKRARKKAPDAPPTVDNLKVALDAIAKRQVAVQSAMADSDASASDVTPPPSDLVQQVAARYGEVIPISGDGLACYVRSLVSAASVIYGIVRLGQIENIVAAISDHLAAVQLRTRAEMIDAGGLVAAEVRRVLAEMVQRLDLQVNVVQWDATTGQITDFYVNDGTAPVWLLYTEGHFSLIRRT